ADVRLGSLRRRDPGPSIGRRLRRVLLKTVDADGVGAMRFHCVWFGLLLSVSAASSVSADDEPATTFDWPPGPVIFRQTEVEKHIRDTLTKPADFSYLDRRLWEVVSDLEAKYQISIELDTQKLAAEGKGGDLLITRSLKDVTLASALRLTLDGEGL